MPKHNLTLGKEGENLAALFLKENGYRILFRNYKTGVGEIDIIAKDCDTLCFVEVKARNSERFGMPQEAVSKIKQMQVSKAALQFMKERHLLDNKARFDVVSILCTESAKKLDLIKNAFELDESFTP